MANTRTYDIQLFDGGIADDIRDLSDLTKCAHVSHFDIYKEPGVMYPMPGYVSDESLNSYSPTSGGKSPGTMADDAGVGTITWSDVNNAKASDDSDATATLTGGGTLEENEVKLVKGGTVVGNNKATGASIPGTDTVVTYGGAADLWGTTLTVSDVEASNFGVVFSAQDGSGGDVSHYLKATNFGFDLPADATINGVIVKIEQAFTSNVVSVDHITISIAYTVPTDEDGIKEHDIKAFFYDSKLRAIGTKENGTGNKLFEKASVETENWSAVSDGEGANDLFENTFLVTNGDYVWFVTKDDAASETYLSYYQEGVGVTDEAATLQTALLEANNDYLVTEKSLQKNHYVNTGDIDLVEVNDDGTISDPICATQFQVTDMKIGDQKLAIVGYNTFPHQGVLSLWDLTANPNETLYNYNIGQGIPRAVGKVGSYWGVVIDEGIGPGDQSQLAETTNGRHTLNIALATGAEVRSHVRLEADTDTNAKAVTSRGTYRDAMLFYARLPQDVGPASYKEGIWAFGMNRRGAPALSLLLDTSSLGAIDTHYPFGYHHFFSHGGDGSVSRLDRVGGTYDVTAVYESLVFGSESSLDKKLSGITIHTEALLNGESVKLKYRKNTQSGWKTMGTSSTEGEKSHTFTKREGNPIGQFTEIQFRVEVTGRQGVNSIYLAIDELENKSYRT